MSLKPKTNFNLDFWCLVSWTLHKNKKQRELLGILFAACLYYSGLVGLARRWRRRQRPHLIVLTFHRASGGDLRRQLLYLRRNYRILPLEEALTALYTPALAPPRLQQRSPLVLTFDDGYQDNYTHAFQLARELQIPITIFLISGYLQSRKPFWWIEAEQLVQQARVEQIFLAQQRYRLGRQEERVALTQAIEMHLRNASSVKEREAFLDWLRKTLSVPKECALDHELLPLTWEEIEEMAESGLVTFGAHSMNHPVLSSLLDPLEVRYEIEASRQILEQTLEYPVKSFAYPVGKPEHIGSVAIGAVKQTGYSWAFTTQQGVNTPDSDPYQLQRIATDVTRHWLVLAAETAGIWQFFAPVWKNTLFDRIGKMWSR